MAGSYTTRGVCEELGINNVCLDLKQEFDALKMNFKEEFDMVFLHPPYWRKKNLKILKKWFQGESHKA